jgi:hypothetical protein
MPNLGKWSHHVVKLGSVAGLNLDLLSNFSAGIDPVAFEFAEYGIEAAFFDLVTVFQAFNHIQVGHEDLLGACRRRRMGCADPFKSSVAAHSSMKPKGAGRM